MESEFFEHFFETDLEYFSEFPRITQSNYSTAYNADQYHKREDLHVQKINNPGRMNLREECCARRGICKYWDGNGNGTLVSKFYSNM